MARFIDADALIEHLVETIEECGEVDEDKFPITYGTIIGLKGALSYAEALLETDVVEVVYCKDCIYARELDKNCEINREYYKHCALWRGDETKNVWHKYKKYYKDYSLVEAWGYCSNGERKGGEAE